MLEFNFSEFYMIYIYIYIIYEKIKKKKRQDIVFTNLIWYCVYKNVIFFRFLVDSELNQTLECLYSQTSRSLGIIFWGIWMQIYVDSAKPKVPLIFSSFYYSHLLSFMLMRVYVCRLKIRENLRTQ